MTERLQKRPLREANRITQILDQFFGKDRFDKDPVSMDWLALEYSGQISPKSPIRFVKEQHIPGCIGALLYGETKPRQWGIAYHTGQSLGRRAFTIAHEPGHFVLHREMIDSNPAYCAKGGIYCDENSIIRRDGVGVEKEADEFAAALLMPFHDFREQLPAKNRPDFKILSRLAKRYGVSLTAAILRWLEYTETRSMMIVSNEGFAHWARSSAVAHKSGRFLRTKNAVKELPSAAVAVVRNFSEEAKAGVLQPKGVWFPEPVVEMCIRSEHYDQEITLLHFEETSVPYEIEQPEQDTFDRFIQGN